MPKNRTQLCLSLALSVAFAGFLAGCSQSTETAAPLTPVSQQGGPGERRGGPGGGMQTIAANASGAEIFQQKCQGCHGEKGEGRSGPNLTKIDDTNAQLHALIHDGKEKMPAFAAQLSDAQIDLVIAHVRTLAVK